MPLIDLDGAVQLSVADFREMIQQVTFAASTDEACPVLMGVLPPWIRTMLPWRLRTDFVFCVGYTATHTQKPFNLIIPAGALTNSRVATEGDEPVFMAVPKGRNQVIFRYKDVDSDSQLIDGLFPDYQQIIPLSFQVSHPRFTALVKACKQAEIFAREGMNVARLDIRQAKGICSHDGDIRVS
jgi:DNA polymerase-3 subunit beta